MSQSGQTAPSQPAPGQPPVVVKKYANRRLYNTETSSYITLDNLAEMIRAGRDFVVYDAKTGEDITRSVLTQIIVEEESKGSAMLPTTFLRQLIGFYGDSLQGVVPRYLEQAMATFAHQQQQMRAAMNPFLPPGFQEIGRQNMQMIERALGLFNPFLRAGTAGAPGAAGPEAGGLPAAAQARPDPVGAALPAPAGSSREPELEAEVSALRTEVESLRLQLAAARADAVMAQATAQVSTHATTDTAAAATADLPAPSDAAPALARPVRAAGRVKNGAQKNGPE